jgi:signal transduction histidine kinase
MTATIDPLLAAVAYLVPGLVWIILAHLTWRFLREWRPENPFFRLLPILAALAALNYGFMMVLALIPPEVHRAPPVALRLVYRLGSVVQVLCGAVSLHLVRRIPSRLDPPGRRWVTIHYVGATLIAALAAFPELIPAPTLAGRLTAFFIIRNAYILLMVALILRHAFRLVRRGRWRPGGLGEVRSTDIALLVIGLVGAGGWVVVSMTRSLLVPVPAWLLFYDMVVGLGLAAPLAVRSLGELAPRFVLAVVMIVAAAAIEATARALRASASTSGLESLVDGGTILLLVVALTVGGYWLRTAIDWILSRPNLRRRQEMEAFFHELPPELGPSECTRRALAELVRFMQLRGAALVPSDDSTPVVSGTLAIDDIARVWARRGAAPAFPAGLVEYGLATMSEELKEALIAADIVGVIAVRSPRREWGHVLITTGLLGATGGRPALEALQSFADQLALVLDATELLARAVVVERSLAHAEKLAAIGELAARIAHEIRNPVTAARSLAQQLAREPGMPSVAEHELILTELERVERQVAALLRFARRDEFHFEQVDLAELARTTVEHFRPRLEAAGIRVDLAAATRVSARADRDKLRQVLVNLIENALDALAENDGKQLTVAVSSSNGTAAIAVADSGPGVPPDALPHLFEPFFSLKAHGTGLGLAIARRTIEAHGGSIHAEGAPGRGMTFRLTVPVA